MLTSKIVEILMKGTLPTTGSGGKSVFNVFHYRVSAGTMDTVANIIDHFRSVVWTPLATNCLSIDYTSTDTLVRYLDDATIQYTSFGGSANGAIALPRLPTDVAVVVRLTGSERGKSARGSKHFGGVPTGFVTKDELNATGIAAWGPVVTLLQNPFTTVGGSTMQPFVLSRKNSQTKINPTTLWGSDVISCTLNKTIGTMRKRREKTVI